MIAIIVATHGMFGTELLRTAQDIVGRQQNAAAVAVTSEMGLEGVGKAITELLTRLDSGQGHLILVDMLGGTPCNAAMLKTKDLPAQVVTGVNLYMMISAFRNRETLGLEALASKVAEDGRKAVVLPKELLRKQAG